ncbi:lipopolysaccharide biosynthesis protein [Geminicoccus flavidas]|uniref:lipopolysaccharide biosynthesis protein n=1 Tax=Geminicoccus flavidas TaxID=2506407 RepID=UPI0013588382|nr:hypothetical protein [Geminicoccus flavidas]
MIGRLRSPLVLSMADQILVSATNLILTFWLIHQWTPGKFGAFAIVLSVSLTGLAAHQALAGSQLALLLVRATSPAERQEVLATTWLVAVGVAVLVGIATTIGFEFFSESHRWATPLLSGLFVALQICREHVRTYHFTRREAGQVLLNDLLQALTVLVALAGAAWVGIEISMMLVVGTLCIATVLACTSTLIRQPGDFTLRFDRKVRRRLRRLWGDHARWALMGAAASEMQTRGHVVAVSTFFSVADLGIIQAALTLMRPVGLLGSAWSKVARPVMARDFAEGRPAAAMRYANLSALGFIGATLVYLMLLWLGWPYLSVNILPAEYGGIGAALPLWGLATLVGLLRTVYSLEAQCVPLFRQSFYASMIAMLTIFVGLAVAVLVGTATSTILVIAIGEAAALVALILIIRRHVDRMRPAPTLPSEGSTPWH